MALPYVFVSGTTIYAAQVNANFAAVALTDLSNLSLAKTAGNVIIGTGSGFASNALTAGSGITITPGAGTVTIAASGATTLTIGTSTVASASNGYILYNNSGVLGNYAISGSGTTVAMATGATLNQPIIAAGGHTVTPQLTAPSYAQGIVWYDSGNDGLSYFNGATGNQVIAGQEVQIRVYNATASTIPIATPVYITGAFSGLPTISACLNTSFAAAQCIGLTTQAIAASGTGYVLGAGTLRGVNTSGYTSGATLYVGSTAGTMVTTQPGSGSYATIVGYCSVVDASAGKITVKPGPPATNSSGGLTVGSSAIAGGTSGRVLYDNAGVLGELATTGSGSVVQATSPTLVTPALGTPASAVLTNATGLPLTTGVTGTLPVANGGTGTATPSLVAGTNVTISGSWPNQTVNASGGGSSIPVWGTTPDLSYCWDSAYLNIKASSGYVMPSMANACLWNNPYAFVPSTPGLGITVDATTLNGYAVVSSAASSGSRYSGTSSSIMHNATIFAVVNVTAFSGAYDIMCGTTGSLEFRTTASGYLELVKCFTASIGTSSSTLTASTWVQVNATYNDSTGAYAFRIAKATAGSGTNAQSISAGTNGLFWNPQGANGDFNGKVAFVASYNRVLTLAEIQAIEAYITSTYGV